MFKQIIIMLNALEAYNESENIEVAKGKYSLPKTWKDIKKQFIREIKYTKKDK